MHALVFVLRSDATSEAVDDVAILNELPLADYTEEISLQDQHFVRLAEILEKQFGTENLAIDTCNRRITVNRSGVIRYFNSLRAALKRTIDSAMDKPIEDFIYLRGQSDWYAIKTLIDDSFDTQFYMDGYGCGSVTVFTHHLYVQMGYEQTDSITLELTQVFDAHF